MAIFYRQPPPFVGGKQPLAPPSPGTAVGITTSSVSSDTGGPLEWQRVISCDAACQVEWPTALRVDRILPSEWEISLATDSSVLVEWRSGAFRDMPDSADWLVTLQAIAQPPVETHATVSVDSIPPATEWCAALLSDSIGYMERRTTLQADQKSPTEVVVSLAQNSVVIADFTVVAARDVPFWPEWQYSLRTDSLWPIVYAASPDWTMPTSSDWRSVAQIELQPHVETKVSVYADWILPTEGNSTVISDRMAFADMLSSTSVNISPSPEFSRSTAIIGDASIPLEWRSVAVSDRLAFADILSSATRNVVIRPEFNGITGIIGDSSVPLEWRTTFQSDRPLSFDVTQSVSNTGALNTDFLATSTGGETIQSGWASTIQLDGIKSADWVHVAVANSAASLAWSVSLPTSYLSSIDWTAQPPQIAQDAIFAIEWTSPTHQAIQDSEISIEWNTRQSADASFSLIWTKPRITKGSAAIQALSSSPISPASPVAPTTKGGATANYLVVKSV